MCILPTPHHGRSRCSGRSRRNATSVASIRRSNAQCIRSLEELEPPFSIDGGCRGRTLGRRRHGHREVRAKQRRRNKERAPAAHLAPKAKVKHGADALTGVHLHDMAERCEAAGTWLQPKGCTAGYWRSTGNPWARPGPTTPPARGIAWGGSPLTAPAGEPTARLRAGARGEGSSDCAEPSLAGHEY